MVFERCVPDVRLFCPSHRFLLCHHRRHGHLGLGLDHHQYYLAVVAVVAAVAAVGSFLLDQLPFLFLALVFKLIVYRD